MSAAALRLATSDRVADALYREDDIVRMLDLHVIAIIIRVHRSIGTAARYDMVDEEGTRHEYVSEHDLYPDILQQR